MTPPRRARFVALTRLLQQHHPELPDPARAIVAGWIVVNGATITNPDASVRRDARIRVVRPHPLRGEVKLTVALDALGVTVRDAVAVDVGAAAGGFTSALLARGAARVYAVDVGFGQLAGRLRADDRVVDLERTNVASVDARVVPDTVDLVTIDVSYLALSEAVRSLGRLRLAPDAALIGLVKPTFELRAGTLVTAVDDVHRAIRSATSAIAASGWWPVASTLPAVTGAGGAVEAFVLAHRSAAPAGDAPTVRVRDAG